MNFNSEKIGHKNLSAHKLLSKSMPHFLRFMAKNDVKRFDWFVRTRVLMTNFFRIEIHQSRANLWRFFDFQAITLPMSDEKAYQEVVMWSKVLVLCQ